MQACPLKQVPSFVSTVHGPDRGPTTERPRPCLCQFEQPPRVSVDRSCQRVLETSARPTGMRPASSATHFVASGSCTQRRRTAPRPHLAHPRNERFLPGLRHDRRMDDRGSNQPDASGSMRQRWGTLIEINRRTRYDFLFVE
jgi:hypothetical protein